MDQHRLMALFLTEGRELLGTVDSELAILEHRSNARASIDAVFRAMHSMKSMCATVGLHDAASALHNGETLLDSARGLGDISAGDVAALVELNDAMHRVLDECERGRIPIAVAVHADAIAPASAGHVGDAAPPAPLAPTDSVLQTGRSVRIPAQRLDDLLNLVGELVIARDRLQRELAVGASDAGADALDRASRLITQLRDAIVSSRMVPLSQVFDRFPRHVRETAHVLGKEVELVIEGRDTEVDRSLLDAMSDAILHLLRNAVDHGIELPAERAQNGKGTRGRLLVRAVREGPMIAVTVHDDGRGVDRDRVAASADARGVADAWALAATDAGLLHLLALPGLSTAPTITEFSGRGVGVDVVLSRVQALGGRLDLTTSTGVGTAITVRLPLSVAVIRVLLVRAGRETYGIPLSLVRGTHLVEVLRGTRSGCLPSILDLADESLPLVDLRAHLQVDATDDVSGHVVVLDGATGRVALLVDACLAQQEIVAKPMQRVRGSSALFSGGTILADGMPSLILDINAFT
jgi:two-component system, chemotaxis family, sensor kinase CheA